MFKKHSNKNNLNQIRTDLLNNKKISTVIVFINRSILDILPSKQVCYMPGNPVFSCINPPSAISSSAYLVESEGKDSLNCFYNEVSKTKKNLEREKILF